ncbi:unnamed protein product [Lactuca virosa]|uniref:Trafficking protein particle complex subunit n=1 Tax=Lactuca virosa TaxID=75947 RepID=A0AAU9NZS6_9ASTR|nr:unnamed protein product [Lactuca virosa]
MDPPSCGGVSKRMDHAYPLGLSDYNHMGSDFGFILLRNSPLLHRRNSPIGIRYSYNQMASTACFMIISRNDIPIYDAEVGSAPKKEEAAHQHQFILHAALDVVQDLAWTTSAMFLKSVDRFNDLVVSVYVTAGHILFIFTFFQEVHELYIKILLNPLYLPGSRVTSSHFDTKVRALARRYL